MADNVPYVSVTLCAPGTSNCQTIDHVLLDTGSVGLRIPASVLKSSLLSALPLQTDANANPVGECYNFVDGYLFGSVRSADFQIGGESVSAMPVNVVGDSGVFATAPRSCSSGSASNLNSVQALGANGILGVGLTSTDCGTTCTSAGGYGAAIYYDCPTTGCASIIGRAASTTAPFQQLPNPVAAMSVDNNGVIVSLPAAPAAGEASMTGTLYFGIGTQSNNAIGSATVLTTSTSSSSIGPGYITIVYNGRNYKDSVLDSGSNAYYFVDSSIKSCSSSTLAGFYCPSSPTNLNITLQGLNGSSSSQTILLNNAQTIFSNTNYSVAPGIGINPNQTGNISGASSSFDLGLTFFYGRNVFFAIEGRSAGGVSGPFFAF